MVVEIGGAEWGVGGWAEGEHESDDGGSYDTPESIAHQKSTFGSGGGSIPGVPDVSDEVPTTEAKVVHVSSYDLRGTCVVRMRMGDLYVCSFL